jgi:hypothetical protein
MPGTSRSGTVRMSGLSAAGAGLAMMAAAAAVGAAPPKADAPPAVDRDGSDTAELRKWYEHGECLVKRNGAAAEKILAWPPESREYLAAFLKAEGPADCFTGGKAPSKLHGNATRGAVAEALLRRDLSAIGSPRRGRLAAIFPDEPTALGRAIGDGTRARAFLRLGECVVRLEPVRSFALFSTPVASVEERRAFEALVPAMADCLPPGLEVQMRPPMVRSYLAEAAYRVSVQQIERGRR